MPKYKICCFFTFIIFVSLISETVIAGPVNPDISVIGQVIAKNTNDPNSQDAGKTTLELGETEIQCNAYLNPYSKGTFVFAICPVHGLHIEEAYVNLFKGLGDGIGMKAGKYRVGFGKLNAAHPHTYPFIETPRVVSSMLPGEDGFNDTGVQASYLLPFPGSWASTISFDLLKGASFHPDEPKSANGFISRWSNSVLINDETPLEVGISAAQGINNVQWNTKTNVYGADIKTKIQFSAITKLTLQGEYFYNDADIVDDITSGAYSKNTRSGFYAFANLEFWQGYNGGIIYDQYNPLENKNLTNRTIKGFVGYTLLEETTVFRLTWEQFMPENAQVTHTVGFQLVFSMGPHKAHQY